MTIARCSAFLFLITTLSYGQAPQEHHRVDSSSQAEIPVRRLYQQLVSRPLGGGIPTPEEMKLLSPYLSSSLLHRITQTRACANDWFRLHPKKFAKPPFAWGEFGLFSGADDRGSPQTFRIEKIESENDSSFLAYIRLTEGNPGAKPWTWRVADRVALEGGKYVIDDVIFPKEEDTDTETRLSGILMSGCDGPRWVGLGDNSKD